MRKGIMFVFVLLSVVLLGALVQANINVCKDNFKTTETVYVRSLSRICYNQEVTSKVNLYIVEDKEASFLNILETAEIQNSQFSCIGVWENPSPGDYDIFVDCNKNAGYDADSNEPFDEFTVIAVAGSARAKESDTKISDHVWMYDPEDVNFVNNMLSVSLIAEGEDVELENITLKSAGTGNDTEIQEVNIYSNDILIGSAQPVYLKDNGNSVIPLNLVLEDSVSEEILITYTMKQDIPVGEYSLIVTSVSGKGVISDKIITFSGTPINSAILAVLPEKTCLGQLALSLEPSSTTSGEEVIATMQGLTGCSDKKINLRTNPCGSSLTDEICSCVSGDSGCACKFVSSKSETYYACIDKNQDKDMIDFGEYDFKDLVITDVILEEEEEETEINETVEETGEEAGITGGIIEELKEKVSGTSTLFVLLEITLLLILLVLIVIMFRLKSGGKRTKETDSSEMLSDESPLDAQSDKEESEPDQKKKPRRRRRAKKEEATEETEE